MYLKQKDRGSYWVLDIETDDLRASVIWCCIIQNIETGEVKEFYDRDTFSAFVSDDHIYIGHNILSFDALVLNRLWGSNLKLDHCIDSLVLSYLYNPAIQDGHSLEAWGHRLKKPKGTFSDFSRLTPEMVKYCRQDVNVTCELYKQLSQRMVSVGFSELSCEIEHKIRIIIDEQISNGCYFERTRAEGFCDFLRKRQSSLAENISSLFPRRRTKVAEHSFRRTKDGSPFASYEKHRDKYSEVITYEDCQEPYYECYDMVPFNLGSPKQRIERLLELGWEPVNFTPTGAPKVDEDALMAFSELLEKDSDPRSEAVKALAEYLVVSARLSTIAGNPKTGALGWLGNVQEDSRIHGKVMSCGAASRRMTHSGPNTANVPSAKKAKYGKECRSFWGVKPDEGLIMVGYDAKGLETECFKHWLNSPEANKILDGDIHTDNANELSRIFGRPVDREWSAKTSWYAWMFGSYPPKLSLILKCSLKEAERVFEEIYPNRIPGLKKFIESIQQEWKSNKGRLSCIDGGFVVCPSKSSALNYKIQPTGAVVMKLSSILIKEETQNKGIWNRKLLDVHDEGQHEVLEKEIYKNGDTLRHPFGDLSVECIREAGRRLRFNVPLDGNYAVGSNWSCTH